MLKINQLHKSIGSNKILEDINIDVSEGMIYGFIGHNGAGKTTTMRAIVGLTKFNAGEIIINGKSYSDKVDIVNTIGYLPDNPKFYLYMTALEYMAYVGQYSNQKKIKELLERVGLNKAMNKSIGSYSKGMNQRLGMAVAMVHSPKLMIMDEPTSALDPAGRVELFDMIKELRDQGSTIMLSTHILDDIEKVSDKIGIISDGTMLREGKVDEILADYFYPIFDVKVAETSMINTNYFKGLSWIKEVTTEDQLMSLTVSDVDYAKAHILQTLVDSKMPISGFELRQPSLEDVFIKGVK